jgi:hypothetical protein
MKSIKFIKKINLKPSENKKQPKNLFIQVSNTYPKNSKKIFLKKFKKVLKIRLNKKLSLKPKSKNPLTQKSKNGITLIEKKIEKKKKFCR